MIKKVTLILLIVLLPITIYGNAGTLLMWFSAFHLFIGNLMIGFFEASILTNKFKTSVKRSIILLISANYASLLFGSFILSFITQTIDFTIENIQLWFYFFIVITFIVTLALEFVFYFYAFKKTERNLKLTLKALIRVNIISYILLFAYYYYPSSASIANETELVPLSQFNITENYEIYYISKNGENIIKKNLKSNTSISLSNHKDESVKKIKSNNPYSQLFIKANKEKYYDLYLHLDPHNLSKENKEKAKLIINNFASEKEVKAYVDLKKEYGSWLSFGHTLNMTENSNWSYYSNRSWPTGINISNESKNLMFNLAMNTPFVSWHIQNILQIENGLVIFQLGRDQICILDPINKKIALIARGRGVVVRKVIGK